MIIFDEKAYAEIILKKGIQNNIHRLYDLQLVAAYLYQAGCGDIEIEQRLHAMCKRKMKGYSRVKFYPIIDKIIRKSKNVKFKVSNEIKITKSEIDTVLSEKDKKIKKLLFVYLVLAKYYMNNNNTDKYYVSTSDVDIFKLARITGKRKSEQGELLHYMTKKGYITPTLNMSSIVNFVDENDEVVITFKPDIDMIYYLEQYLGGSFIKCIICGRLEKKGSNSAKYCKACARERDSKRIKIRSQIQKPEIENALNKLID